MRAFIAFVASTVLMGGTLSMVVMAPPAYADAQGPSEIVEAAAQGNRNDFLIPLAKLPQGGLDAAFDQVAHDSLARVGFKKAAEIGNADTG